MRFLTQPISRRRFLRAGAGVTLAAVLPLRSAPGAPGVADKISEYRLTAATGRAFLQGAPYPQTSVWCYNDSVPGPVLRVPQGGRLRVTVENRLAEGTTVHWHGIRVPNAMDGVPHLTQKPIAPGERFVYEFATHDAGTYWYHPHQRSMEQVDRGLYGALIVEERTPIHVDRDLVWVLDDWRLTPEGAIRDDFGHPRDVTHNGRIGNTITLNGRVPQPLKVQPGERLRLRLINAANARIFALKFTGHAPQVIAYDGQPVAPHAPEDNEVFLAPGQRVDLILDMLADPGKSYAVMDGFFARRPYKLLELHYTPPALRTQALQADIRLPDNPLAEPQIKTAERHSIGLGGGMMGRRLGMMTGNDVSWTINGVTGKGHEHKTLLTLKRGRSYVFAVHNDTAWHHPMHLHGMVFRVLSRNGQPLSQRIWQDTVLLDPDERVEIAFLADNPGDWMLHCHILEHQDGGMMGVIRVV